jgi:hypothetical protein
VAGATRPYARPVPAAVNRSAAPWTVRAGAALAVIEAIGAVGFALRFLVDVLPFEDEALRRAAFAFGVEICVVGSAAVLLLAARALAQQRRWSRSLLLVAQVMGFAIGWPMIQGGDWVGWVLVAMAAVGVVLLLHPATTAALERDERS